MHIKQVHIMSWLRETRDYIGCTECTSLSLPVHINHEGVMYFGESFSVSTQAARIYDYRRGRWHDMPAYSAYELYELMREHGYWELLSAEIERTGAVPFVVDLGGKMRKIS